jgi:hypothetical protein
MTRERTLFLGTLVLLVAACGNETGVPHPDPLPDVARSRASALFPGVTGQVLVVGLPGCVAGAGEVTIETLGTSFKTAATSSGSFVLEVTSRAGELLALRYRTSEPATKKVETSGIKTVPPPEPIAGVPPLTALGGGRFRVEGRSRATTAASLFATNARTGEVATAASDASGRFALELGAVTGDSLEIYDDLDPIGIPWNLLVP